MKLCYAWARVLRKAAKMFGNDLCHLTIFFSISGLIVKTRVLSMLKWIYGKKNPLLLSILMYWEILEVFLNSKIRLLSILKLIWGRKILFITVLWSFLKRWILRQKNWPFCFIQTPKSISKSSSFWRYNINESAIFFQTFTLQFTIFTIKPEIEMKKKLKKKFVKWQKSFPSRKAAFLRTPEVDY